MDTAERHHLEKEWTLTHAVKLWHFYCKFTVKLTKAHGPVSRDAINRDEYFLKESQMKTCVTKDLTGTEITQIPKSHW